MAPETKVYVSMKSVRGNAVICPNAAIIVIAALEIVRDNYSQFFTLISKVIMNGPGSIQATVGSLVHFSSCVGATGTGREPSTKEWVVSDFPSKILNGMSFSH